jgi:adenine-specific DNA-methyltransferase
MRYPGAVYDFCDIVYGVVRQLHQLRSNRFRGELDFKHLMEEIAATKFGAQYASPRMDLWYYFVHRGLELLSSNGRLGFIVNSYWTSGTGAEKLISDLKNQHVVEEIFYLGDLKVFRKVSGSHMILLLNKRKTKETITIRHCLANGEVSAEPFVTGKAKVSTLEKTADHTFRGTKVDISIRESSYLDKLDRSLQLSQIAIVRQGIAENPSTINNKTAKKFKGKFNVGDGVFMISKAEKRSLSLSAEEESIVRPYHDLRDIDRYYIAPSPKHFIIYSTKETVPDIAKYPNLKRHLEPFKEIMSKRRETQNKSNKWWHLHWPRDENIWKSPKIIVLQMAKRPSFVFSEKESYTTFSTNVIMIKNANLDLYYRVLAVLNSKTIWAWLCHYAKRRGIGLEINGNVIEKIPVPKGIENDTPNTIRLSELAKARTVTEMESRKSKTESDRNIKVRQIDTMEAEIDKIVYELFDLTAAEVAEVERQIQ